MTLTKCHVVLLLLFVFLWRPTVQSSFSYFLYVFGVCINTLNNHILMVSVYILCGLLQRWIEFFCNPTGLPIFLQRKYFPHNGVVCGLSTLVEPAAVTCAPLNQTELLCFYFLRSPSNLTSMFIMLIWHTSPLNSSQQFNGITHVMLFSIWQKCFADFLCLLNSCL